MASDLPRTARAANALTLAGALPFLALTALLPFGKPLADALELPALGQQIEFWAGIMLVLYAAVILSFLGGIRFGVAVAEPLRPGARRDVIVSVLPSLAAWGLAIVGGLGLFSGLTVVTGGALALFAACFLLQWAWDRRAASAGTVPEWFGRMRSRITAIVAPTLAVAAVLVTL